MVGIDGWFRILRLEFEVVEVTKVMLVENFWVLDTELDMSVVLFDG